MKKTRRVPIGINPRLIDGIVIRKFSEIPEGVQALYYKGELQGVFRIGQPVPGVRCDAITLSHRDYEVVLKCFLEREQRERRRRFKGPVVKLPSQAEIELVVKRSMGRMD